MYEHGGERERNTVRVIGHESRSLGTVLGTVLGTESSLLKNAQSGHVSGVRSIKR